MSRELLGPRIIVIIVKYINDNNYTINIIVNAHSSSTCLGTLLILFKPPSTLKTASILHGIDSTR